jgi:hypothetical protein
MLCLVRLTSVHKGSPTDDASDGRTSTQAASATSTMSHTYEMNAFDAEQSDD